MSQDINECETVDCLNGGTCADMIGTYECACTTGWMTTKNIKLCATSPAILTVEQVLMGTELTTGGWDEARTDEFLGAVQSVMSVGPFQVSQHKCASVFLKRYLFICGGVSLRYFICAGLWLFGLVITHRFCLSGPP